MKKVKLLIFITFCVGFLKAQTPIVSGIGNIGSIYKMYIDSLPANAINFGIVGVSQVFNLTSAVAKDSSLNYILSPSGIANIGSLAVLCNKALLTVRALDSTLFLYNEQVSNISTIANRRVQNFGGQLVPFLSLYSPAYKNYSFPLVYNSNFNASLQDSTQEQIKLDIAQLTSNVQANSVVDSIRVTITSKMMYAVDGSGSLQTPEETVAFVLRLKKYEQQFVHIELKGLPLGAFLGIPLGWSTASNIVLSLLDSNLRNDTLLKFNSYEYWTNGRYGPLATVSYLANNDSVLQVSYQKSFLVNSIANNRQEVADATLFPNPANDVLYIKSTSVFKQALIIDSKGVLVKTIILNDGQKISLPTSILSGMYTIKMLDANNNIYTQKIRVQK